MVSPAAAWKWRGRNLWPLHYMMIFIGFWVYLAEMNIIISAFLTYFTRSFISRILCYYSFVLLRHCLKHNNSIFGLLPVIFCNLLAICHMLHVLLVNYAMSQSTTLSSKILTQIVSYLPLPHVPAPPPFPTPPLNPHAHQDICECKCNVTWIAIPCFDTLQSHCDLNHLCFLLQYTLFLAPQMFVLW